MGDGLVTWQLQFPGLCWHGGAPTEAGPGRAGLSLGCAVAGRAEGLSLGFVLIAHEEPPHAQARATSPRKGKAQRS